MPVEASLVLCLTAFEHVDLSNLVGLVDFVDIRRRVCLVGLVVFADLINLVDLVDLVDFVDLIDLVDLDGDVDIVVLVDFVKPVALIGPPNVRIKRLVSGFPSTGRNSAHARDGEMFMESEKCAHLSVPVASRGSSRK